MSVFLKTLKVVTRVFLYIGYAAILIMCALTVYDVIMRYFFGRPMSGVTEWSQMLLIISMATLAHAIVDGRYIAVSVLVDRFPKKLNIAFEIVVGFLCFVFFIFIGIQLINQIKSSIAFNESYFVVKTPRWPFYGVLGVSYLASALGTVVYVIERVTNFKSPHDKNVFDENPDLAILAFADEDDKNEEETEL